MATSVLPTPAPVVPSGASKSKLLVMKFGGSSLKDAKQMRVVAEIIKEKIAQGDRPIIVCSAMGKTTNGLISASKKALVNTVVRKGPSLKFEPSPTRTASMSLSVEEWLADVIDLHMHAAKDLKVAPEVATEIEDLLFEAGSILSGVRLIREVSGRTRDLLMSFGERMSVRMLAGYLNTVGIPARAFDSWEVGMKTTVGSGSDEADVGTAEVLPSAYDEIKESLGFLEENYEYTPIITGFIAQDPNGVITTLGRGGSDLSGSIIGCAVGAREIEIWTDVNGILTADPRVCKDATHVPTLTFDEASELAYFGAKVLHPRTIKPAMKAGIPVRVKNTFNPSHPGTLIIQNPETKGRVANKDDPRKVLALTHKSGVTLLDINSTDMLGQPGFLSNVFGAFERFALSVDVIATSEVSVSVTLDKGAPIEKVQGAVEYLSRFANVHVGQNRTIVSLISNTSKSAAIIAEACGVFRDLDVTIDMVSCGASRVNITFVIEADSDVVNKAMATLHTGFFPPSVTA